MADFWILRSGSADRGAPKGQELDVKSRMAQDPQDHSQIVPGTAQNGVERITETALEPVLPQLAFVLHVADGRFNRATSMNGSFDRWGQAALLSATPDRHALDADTAITSPRSCKRRLILRPPQAGCARRTSMTAACT